MVKAGEETGSVDSALNKIADMLEGSFELKQKFKQILTYPIYVVVVCILVLFVFAQHVLPVFVALFEGAPIELPLPTRILIGFFRFIGDPAKFTLGLLFASVVFAPLIYYRRTLIGGILYDSMKFKLPVVGKLIKLFALSQFCKTFARLYSCGINLIRVLEITGKAVGNEYVMKTCQEMEEQLRAGMSMGQIFREQEFFPKFVSQMTEVGEETGDVQHMLEKVSQIYDQQLEYALALMLNYLNPLILLVLGIVVCFILLALFLPLYQFINIL